MTPDTSVVVAAFARWHERHESAKEALTDCPDLVGHVAVETFSVLTRLPKGRNLPACVVDQLLQHHFSGKWIVLSGAQLQKLLQQCAAGGIRGGASYDALVAGTAAAEKLQLVTLDQRAAVTYRAVGAETVVL